MTWVFVIIILAIVLIMAVNNSGRLPWGDKMRRLNANMTRQAEWMAPEAVVQQVRVQFLDAINWLHESALLSWAQQWSDASDYLAGNYLRRYRNLLLTQRDSKSVQFSGVLRADHVVEARAFSESGGTCVIIDHQSQRRMATYNRRTQERLHTQDLGDGAVVFLMIYDAKDGRWKIGSLVQELPVAWRTRPLIQEATLPGAIGRDY